MIKQILSLIFVTALAGSAQAGLSYNFQSVSTGMRDTTVAGTATADQGKMRLDVKRGDGALLKDNTVALSINSGRALRVIDASSKTYYDVDLEQLLGGVSALMQQLGGVVKISVQNAKVKTRDDGDGGTIEGYQTRRVLVNSEYDLVLDAFGEKTTIHVATNSQNWITQALPADMTSVFQMNGVKTGIEDIDKLIQTQMGSLNGFPLKQVTTFHANDMDSTTTTTITSIQKKDVDAALFETPPGFTKVDSPFDALLKTMKGLGK
ncbi:MAG: DUF4412 domain-containing protein [Thermoanaerobaculia bacterium]